MHKFLAVTVFVLGFSCVVFSSTGLSNEISNIQFQNVTQTSVDVVWTTVHPSTSQVLLARDTNYEPERWIPATADPQLVTQHRVTVDHLVPYNSATGEGQYYIYVASVTGGGTSVTGGGSSIKNISSGSGSSGGGQSGRGQLSTAPGPQDGTGTHPLMSMRTLPTNVNGAPNTLAYTYGPTTAYTGHDMYFSVQPILVSGPVGHLYIQNVGGYNNDTDGVVTPSVNIGVHYSCQWQNASGLDSAEQWYSAGQKMGFCYNGNNQNYHTVRLRIPANTRAGSYSVRIRLLSNGQTINVDYPFTVKQATAGVPVPRSAAPGPIPGLATWETQMDTLGKKWCSYRDAQDALGKFEAWGWAADAWYYDGGRVFQQIDDYTANVLQTPNHAYWQHCAQAILNPYAYWQIANRGAMQGFSIFPYGMTMNYWRTHDMVMLNAVNTLATMGSQSVTPVRWIRGGCEKMRTAQICGWRTRSSELPNGHCCSATSTNSSGN